MKYVISEWGITMKKKLKIFTIIAGCITIAAMIYIIRKIYKAKELNNLLNGISELNSKEEKIVSISDSTNRYLLKNNDEVKEVFNQFMELKGWVFDRQYGRSVLYTNGYREMLVKKIDLVNGFCIFEWMDEDYVKNRVI